MNFTHTAPTECAFVNTRTNRIQLPKKDLLKFTKISFSLTNPSCLIIRLRFINRTIHLACVLRPSLLLFFLFSTLDSLFANMHLSWSVATVRVCVLDIRVCEPKELKNLYIHICNSHGVSFKLPICNKWAKLEIQFKLALPFAQMAISSGNSSSETLNETSAKF